MPKLNYGSGKYISPEKNTGDSEVRQETILRLHVFVNAEKVLEQAASYDLPTANAKEVTIENAATQPQAKSVNPLFEQAREQIHDVVERPTGNVLNVDAVRQAVEEAQEAA